MPTGVAPGESAGYVFLIFYDSIINFLLTFLLRILGLSIEILVQRLFSSHFLYR